MTSNKVEQILKEYEQYKALGSVEKCKNAIHTLNNIIKMIEIEQSPTSCEHTKLVTYSNIEKVAMEAYINGDVETDNVYDVELD